MEKKYGECKVSTAARGKSHKGHTAAGACYRDFCKIISPTCRSVISGPCWFESLTGLSEFLPCQKIWTRRPPAATPRLVQKPRDKRTNCQFLLITRLSDLLQTRGFVMNMSPVQKQPWWKKKTPHKASRKIRWRMKVRREFSNKEITALLRSAVN